MTISTVNTAPLTGRVAVVTGASSGIGEATAKRLAASGAKVALLARRAERLEKIANEIEQDGGTALVLPVDVTDVSALRSTAERVATELGTADLLFNNAGVVLAAPIEEAPVEQWQQQIDINVTGLMNVIGAFVPQLVAAAADKGVADLVNTSSIAAHGVFPSFAVYSGTKAYVTHVSRTLRTELGEKDVRVSVIEPGLVETELQGHVTDPSALEWLDSMRGQITWLDPEDVAEAINFLASQPARVNLPQITIMPTRQAS